MNPSSKRKYRTRNFYGNERGQAKQSFFGVRRFPKSWSTARLLGRQPEDVEDLVSQNHDPGPGPFGAHQDDQLSASRLDFSQSNQPSEFLPQSFENPRLGDIDRAGSDVQVRGDLVGGSAGEDVFLERLPDGRGKLGLKSLEGLAEQVLAVFGLLLFIDLLGAIHPSGGGVCREGQRRRTPAR